MLHTNTCLGLTTVYSSRGCLVNKLQRTVALDQCEGNCSNEDDVEAFPVSLQIKCDQYWPSRGTETYGMIQVTLLDTMELATFCVRTLSLHKVNYFPSLQASPVPLCAPPRLTTLPFPLLITVTSTKTCFDLLSLQLRTRSNWRGHEFPLSLKECCTWTRRRIDYSGLRGVFKPGQPPSVRR